MKRKGKNEKRGILCRSRSSREGGPHPRPPQVFANSRRWRSVTGAAAELDAAIELDAPQRRGRAELAAGELGSTGGYVGFAAGATTLAGLGATGAAGLMAAGVGAGAPPVAEGAAATEALTAGPPGEAGRGAAIT